MNLPAWLDAELPRYLFDHYRLYPSQPAQPPRWQTYWHTRLQQLIADPHVRLFHHDNALLALRISPWDSEHFGFPLAQLHVLLTTATPDLPDLLAEVLAHARAANVRVLTTRVNGDQLAVLHALEDHGFRYYDDAIWPVVAVENLQVQVDPRVRMARTADRPRLLELAQKWTYPRGHFYCDPRFDRDAVDRLYAKWLQTALDQQTPIAVIESAGVVQGFFQFSVEPLQQTPLGHRYAHLRLLALDGSARGQGLGAALFASTLALCQQFGAQFIDSGYSSKNHVSARLHTRHGFLSMHEEVTLHAWLDV